MHDKKMIKISLQAYKQKQTHFHSSHYIREGL